MSKWVEIRRSAGRLDLRGAEAAEAAARVGGVLDAFGEGAGGGTGGLDRPVHAAVVFVEPEQGPDLRVFARHLGQHFPDPGRLRTPVLAGGNLTDHQRLVRRHRFDQIAVARAVELAEGLPLPGAGGVGAPVVAVEAGPVDIFVAGVLAADRLEVFEPAVPVDVRAPDPGDVGHADRGEDVVHVAPGGDEFAGFVAVDAL